MKKIAATILTFLVGTGAAFAHHMEGGSIKGLFGLKPEYIHVLLNPLLTYGLGIGVLILAAGLLARNRSARVIGLVLTAIAAASAWPVLFYGQRAYNDLFPLLDTESQQWLDVHMDRAEHFIYFFYATALVAIAALVWPRKSPKVATAFSVLALVIGLASLGIGGWIARAGGEVSHSEFRGEGAPPPVSAEEHHSENSQQKQTNE